MSLARAGAFLVLSSARNRVRVAVRKLRSPRYLVGAAALGLYLASIFGRAVLRANPGTQLSSFQHMAGAFRGWFELGVTVLGACLVVSTWTLGADQLSFSFTEAEASWLLSGPLTRRDLVRYKVAVGLLRTLLSATLATLVFRRGVAAAPLPLLLGSWLGFALVWLHGALASLVRVRWRQRHVSTSRRLLVGAALLAVFLWVGAVAVHNTGPLPGLEGDFREMTGPLSLWMQTLVGQPVLQWLLVPARAFAGAVFAPSLGAAVGPLAVLFLLGVCLLVPVVLLDVPLEEAVLASAERRARLEAWRRGRFAGRPAPGRLRVARMAGLSAKGPAEVALAWKNWLALRRVYGARLGFALVIAGGGFVPMVWGLLRKSHRGSGLLLVAAGFAASLAVLTVLLGPLSFRTDLRSDLRRLDVLRTLPLSGVQVVRGELLAPALLLAATEVALLILALGLASTSPLRGFPWPSRLAWAAGAALLLPAATAAVLVVQNAAALVFPSLLLDDEERAPKGVEAAGTRLVSLAATLLLLLAGVLPCAILGLAVGAGAAWAGLGVLATTVGCAAAACVLLLEVAIALRWMGRGLEALDPTTA